MATKTHGESQFVLRFPRRLAARVQELMDQQGPHAIIIDAKTETECIVTVDGNRYPATLVDLPAHVESYRTMNRRTYFKSGDIGQALVVHKDERAAETFRQRVAKTGTHPSGITPPMRNIARTYKRQPYNKKEQPHLVERAAALLRSSKPQYEEHELLPFYPSIMESWEEGKSMEEKDDPIEVERKKGFLPIPGIEAYRKAPEAAAASAALASGPPAASAEGGSAQPPAAAAAAAPPAPALAEGEADALVDVEAFNSQF